MCNPESDGQNESANSTPRALAGANEKMTSFAWPQRMYSSFLTPKGVDGGENEG